MNWCEQTTETIKRLIDYLRAAVAPTLASDRLRKRANKRPLVPFGAFASDGPQFGTSSASPPATGSGAPPPPVRGLNDAFIHDGRPRVGGDFLAAARAAG